MPLVDIRDLATYLRRDLDAFDTATGQLMLDGACAATAEYCGWHISPSITETLTLDGSGTQLQPLPSMYVTAVNTVTEDGNTVAASAYDWSASGILDRRDGGLWTARRRGVSVNLTHGYTTTPAWLVTLICAAAGRAFAGSIGLGVVQESSGGESITYLPPGRGGGGAVTLLPEEQQVLSRLRVT